MICTLRLTGAGWRLKVKATARTPAPVSLRVQITGGDQDGVVITLPNSGRILLGRTQFHGDLAYPNHVILTQEDARVSRRALVLRRGPEGLLATVPKPEDRALVQIKRGDHLRSFERMIGGCVFTSEDQLLFAEGEIALRLLEEATP